MATQRSPHVQSLVDQFVATLVATFERQLDALVVDVTKRSSPPRAPATTQVPRPAPKRLKIKKPRRRQAASKRNVIVVAESTSPSTNAPSATTTTNAALTPIALPAQVPLPIAELVVRPASPPVDDKPTTTRPAPKRFWLRRGENPATTIAAALAWLAKNTNEGETALLVTGSASLAGPDTTIGKALGFEIARALQRGLSVEFGNNGRLQLAPKARLPRDWSHGPVVVAWSRQDLLDIVDRIDGVTAIVVVPWSSDDETWQWRDRWNAAELRDA